MNFPNFHPNFWKKNLTLPGPTPQCKVLWLEPIEPGHPMIYGGFCTSKQCLGMGFLNHQQYFPCYFPVIPLWQCFIYITFQYVFKMIFYVCCFFGLFSLRNSGVSRWPLPLWAVPHQSKRRPRWSTTHRRTPRLPEAQQLRRLLLFFDSKKTQCHMVMAWFLETIVMAWIPPGWLLGIEVEWNLPKLFDGNANLRIKIKLAFRDCSPATWAATAFTNRPLSWP